MLPVLRDKQTLCRGIISQLEPRHRLHASGNSRHKDLPPPPPPPSRQRTAGSQGSLHRSNPDAGPTYDPSLRRKYDPLGWNFPMHGIDSRPRPPSVEESNDVGFVDGSVLSQPSSINDIGSPSSPSSRRTSTSGHPFRDADTQLTASKVSADRSSSSSMVPPSKIPQRSPAVPGRTNIKGRENLFDSQPATTIERPMTIPASSTSQFTSQVHAGTTKSKKGILGFTSDMGEIGTSDDPVRFTHLGFSSSAGDFSGLPKEWKELLRMSNISRAASSIWDEMGTVIDQSRDEACLSAGLQDLVSSLIGAACSMRDPK